MLHLPTRFASIILTFASMFVQQRTWRHAQLLLLGALLAPGQRTVCRILRVVGSRQERHFVNYHRVLNRAVWHSLLGACLLLDLLLRALISAIAGLVAVVWLLMDHGKDSCLCRARHKHVS